MNIHELVCCIPSTRSGTNGFSSLSNNNIYLLHINGSNLIYIPTQDIGNGLKKMLKLAANSKSSETQQSILCHLDFINVAIQLLRKCSFAFRLHEKSVPLQIA